MPSTEAKAAIGSAPERQVILADRPVHSFWRGEPARWRVGPGQPIEVRCPDGVLGQIRTESDVLARVDPKKVNPVTGPIWVEGAEPGDTVVFVIEKIDVPQDWGYVLLVPGFGLLAERVANPVTKIVPLKDGRVVFNGLSLPLRPCIGTIGVSPRRRRLATLIPHDHGGNLDTADITTGSKVYLPVHVRGAGLALGDPKAVMGDGEVCGTGVGVPINVFAHIQLLKAKAWPRPIVETRSEWQAVASAETLEAACALATLDFINILRAVTRMSWNEAYMFLSLAGNLRISQVVDPLMTVRMCVTKEQLPSIG